MSQRSRIVLIVDDSPEDRILYQHCLLRDSNYSYTFLEASLGQQGLELWRQQQPDVILLDYCLPDLDGLTFLTQLQSVTQSSCLPVIIVTGQGSEAIAVQSMKAGAQNYLIKREITSEKLHLAVNEAIETVQLRNHLQQQSQQQRLVTAMTQRIRQSLNLQDILQTTVDQVRQFLQVDRVILFQFSPEWGGKVTVESVADQALAIFPLNIYDPCIGETHIEPFKQGLVTAKADIYRADISTCHVEFLAQFQVRANLVVPILKDDGLWGLLVAHHCVAPRPWQELEIELLRQLASQVSIALQQAALLEQVQTELTERKQAEIALQTLNTELEQRVTERTAELTAINDRLLVAFKEQAQTEAALQQQTRQEQLLWNVTQSIRQSLDLNAILNTAVAEVRQTLQGDRVAVYRFQPDWSGDFIAESVGAGWVKLVEPEVQKVCEDTHLQDTKGGRFQKHETFVISDIYTARLHSCHIALLEQFEAKAYAVAPIFSGITLWGLLAIYQNATPRHWQTWEIELLQQIASQLSIAIQQSELYRQLQVELIERQQATAIIREAERRWRSLLDNVQLIVVGLDQVGNINYVNAFFLSLTGYTDSEVMGKNWFENFFSSSSQPSIQAVFSEVLAQNTHPYYQSAILTKAGEERFIAWNNTMLQDAQGNATGMISIGEDITERQKVEKIKNEFISIVSHELRTPLTSIRGSLGLLATGVMDDEPDAMKRMIDIAATDTERLVRLVNDVLDLEKLESGKLSLVRIWCNAANLMQRSLEVMQNSAQEAGVQLVIDPLSLQIWVDPDRIIQTLTNLLSNAIKFSPTGGTIVLSAAIKNSDRQPVEKIGDRGLPHVLFSVQDQGRGIPADKLESIFDRFQQVDASDSRDQGGTGLGLAICQSIVQQHDGQIWVESHWGQGSTFFFTLPLQTR
jgi:PAS domain S-box-containing protein